MKQPKSISEITNKLIVRLDFLLNTILTDLKEEIFFFPVSLLAFSALAGVLNLAIQGRNRKTRIFPLKIDRQNHFSLKNPR